MLENPITQKTESQVIPEKKQIELRQVEFYDQVIESMRRVVHSANGTARSINNGMLYEMAGKTGTAQVIGIPQGQDYDEKNTPKKYRDHSLFIGFAPIDDPQIAIAVIVENGGSGSKVAAPIARRLVDYYLQERLNMFASDVDASSSSTS